MHPLIYIIFIIILQMLKKILGASCVSLLATQVASMTEEDGPKIAAGFLNGVLNKDVSSDLAECITDVSSFEAQTFSIAAAIETGGGEGVVDAL